MLDVQETYLSFRELPHYAGCRRPVWTVDVRTVEAHRSRISSESGIRHECTNEDCGHAGAYERTTVRIVCHACGSVHLITGESETEQCTTTAAIGYGQPARKVAGLYCWPGEPFVTWGRPTDREPSGFLVTAARVGRPRRADVVGQVFQERGRRGGIVWAAAAIADAAAPSYGHIQWTRVKDGHRSVSAAVRWIAAQLTTGGDPA